MHHITLLYGELCCRERQPNFSHLWPTETRQWDRTHKYEVALYSRMLQNNISTFREKSNHWIARQHHHGRVERSNGRTVNQYVSLVFRRMLCALFCTFTSRSFPTVGTERANHAINAAAAAATQTRPCRTPSWQFHVVHKCGCCQLLTCSTSRRWEGGQKGSWIILFLRIQAPDPFIFLRTLVSTVMITFSHGSRGSGAPT